MADVAVTNAQLAGQLSQLATNWNQSQDQFSNWLAGTATGGTQADGVTAGGGYYPLTNAAGVVRYFACPAEINAQATAGLNQRILEQQWFEEG